MSFKSTPFPPSNVVFVRPCCIGGESFDELLGSSPYIFAIIHNGICRLHEKGYIPSTKELTIVALDDWCPKDGRPVKIGGLTFSY